MGMPSWYAESVWQRRLMTMTLPAVTASDGTPQAGLAATPLPEPLRPAAGAVEGGVAEGEEAAVAGAHPGPAAVGCGGHGDDGLVQPGGSQRAVEGSVALGEEAAVGGGQPVPVAGGGSGHAHQGRVEG